VLALATCRAPALRRGALPVDESEDADALAVAVSPERAPESSAVAWGLPMNNPMPNATARPPTRPTNAAAPT
jgi:hypothetical protein